MCLLLTAALAQIVPPDEPREADLNITHAFNRRLAPGWQPYLVTVANNGQRELDLTLVATQRDSNVKITRRVYLSPGAKQQFFFYTFAEYWGYEEIDVELVDETGKRVASPARVGDEGGRYGYEQLGLLVLSGDADSNVLLGLPREIKGRYGTTEPIDRFVCTPERVPDRGGALKMLRLVVLHDYPLDRLNPEQRRALLDYVVGGGAVAIVPGASAAWLEDPFLRQLAPVSVAGTHDVSRLRGGSRPLQLDEPLALLDFDGGEPAIGSGDGVLMVKHRNGNGVVYVATADLNRRELRGWDGVEKGWLSLLGESARRGSALPFHGTDTDRPTLGWAVSNLRRTPPLLMIGGLLLAYTLAIGPLHLLFVRRAKRPLWTLGTIPAVAIGFVALTVGVGWMFRGTTSQTQQINLLTSFSGDRVAHERVLLAVHASAGRSFDIESPEGIPLEPTDMLEMGYGGDTAGVWFEQRGPKTVLREHAIGQFQTRFFVGERAADVGGGITATLDGDTLTVVNGSAMPIEAAVLMRGGESPATTPVEPLAPGARATVSLARAGFDPAGALGRGPDDPVGRMLLGWAEDYRRNLRNLPSTLVCVVRSDAEPAGVDVGTREAATIWIVHLEEPPE